VVLSALHTCASLAADLGLRRREETRELHGERDNARNTHSLDGQHQDVDRTLCERVNQNDRGPGQMGKYVHGVANPRIEDG